MALVSLKCPNCGGSLQMDNTLEKGFCMYCGSSFMVKDEIQRIKVEHSGSVNMSRKEEANNIAILGKMKYGEKYFSTEEECQEILDRYVEKSLTLDITNANALALKRQVEDRIDEIRKSNAQEKVRAQENKNKEVNRNNVIGLIFGLLLVGLYFVCCRH